MRRGRRRLPQGCRRYISTRISVDSRIYALTQLEGEYAALLYTWLIPHADKDGYLPSDDPEEVFLVVTPGIRDKDGEDARRAIAAMVEVGLLECRPDGIAFPLVELRRFNSGNPSPERKAWQLLAIKARPQILERDGYKCVECGSDGPLEVDHVIALARGGSNDDSNLQTLCRDCNRQKSVN